MIDMTDLPLLDLGLTGLVLVVVAMGLRLGLSLWLDKRKQNTLLECQADPAHFQRIREIHKWTENTERRKQRGDFACQFRDRDEVRDFKEILTHSAQATDRLSMEMRQLTAEIRASREANGKAK